MTPREVQISIRAASDRRLDRYDELMAAAYQGAMWGRMDAKKIPKLRDVLSRSRRGRRALTLDQDVARWRAFFRTAVPKGKAN